MANESNKKLSESNIIKNSSKVKSEHTEKDLSASYVEYNEKKNEGCNDWTSVPKTYDKEESCHKHEKTATNNQWCSCNK